MSKINSIFLRKCVAIQKSQWQERKRTLVTKISLKGNARKATKNESLIKAKFIYQGGFSTCKIVTIIYLNNLLHIDQYYIKASTRLNWFSILRIYRK